MKPSGEQGTDNQEMTGKQVCENLCWYDPRHPYYDADNAFTPQELIERQALGCNCDSCHHGRHKLAVEIIRLNAHIYNLQELLDCLIE